nr:MerR family DNA-binding transcriptional regulator [Paenibacillus aestuarii]
MKQASEETGLSIHTLRYYEEISLIEGIMRDENSYCHYSEADIAWFNQKEDLAIGLLLRIPGAPSAILYVQLL